MTQHGTSGTGHTEIRGGIVTAHAPCICGREFTETATAQPGKIGQLVAVLEADALAAVVEHAMGTATEG